MWIANVINTLLFVALTIPTFVLVFVQIILLCAEISALRFFFCSAELLTFLTPKSVGLRGLLPAERETGLIHIRLNRSVIQCLFKTVEKLALCNILLS